MENLIEKQYNYAVKGLTQEILSSSATWYKYVLQLPKPQQIVYTIILFHSQVENGGFHQYFFNVYGQFAYIALKNLRLINAIKRAELLDEALKRVSDNNLDESAFRELIFSRKLSKVVDFEKDLFDYLNSLDSKYYEIESEDIYELLEKYLKESLGEERNL